MLSGWLAVHARDKITREQNNMANELAQFAIKSKDCQCFFPIFQSVDCIPFL